MTAANLEAAVARVGQPLTLRERPNDYSRSHVLVGDDGLAYGASRSDGFAGTCVTYREPLPLAVALAVEAARDPACAKELVAPWMRPLG